MSRLRSGPGSPVPFTGRYPRASGMTGNQERLRDGVTSLPERLREAGYHAALAGQLHLTPTAAPHGFEHDRRHDAMYDRYDPEEPWRSDYVA